MSHTHQNLFFRWVLGAGTDVNRLRAQLGEIGERMLYSTGQWSSDLHSFDVDFDWEFRSQRPLNDAEEALSDGSQNIDAIWIRSRSGFHTSGLDEDSEDVDGIGQIDEKCDRLAAELWRPCRYGFDEIRVIGASILHADAVADGELQIWRGAGSYLARNCQAGLMRQFPDDFPTGLELSRPEPIDVLAMLSADRFVRVEWRWRGRVVHMATAAESAEGVIYHQAADGWDNCADDIYLERFGDLGLRRPAVVYESDRLMCAGGDDD